jgi:hypothetical protein
MPYHLGLLVMRTRSSEEYTADCDYGVVELTDGLLSELHRRRSYLRELVIHDSCASGITFSNPFIAFISAKQLEECFTVTDDDDRDLYEKDYHLFKSFKANPVLIGPSQPVEVRSLVLHEEYFFWTAVPKHSNADITTVWITVEQIEALYQR